jgi:hypothetical protein
MAFTQSDLDNINAAIATGEMTVEVNGRKVTYRSIRELERARTIIQGDLAADANTSSTRRGTYTVRFATARD